MLEAVWGVPRVEVWDELTSTNDRGRELAREGGPAWSVVLTDRQTAGRGRVGRRWESGTGSALTTSILLRPRGAARAGLLPLLTGVAVARAFDRAGSGPTGIQLKWPNDLWLEGGKVGGILCEAAGDSVVVGVGLNLATPPGGFPAAIRGPTVSVQEVTGRVWPAPSVLGAFVAELRLLCTPLPMRFEGAVAEEWAERDLLRGRRVQVGKVDGVAVGLGPDGALRIERPDGTVTSVRAGHVEWTPPGPSPSSMRS